MMTRTNLGLIGALLLSVPACVEDLTAAGQQVHMGKADPEGCRELGRVHGSGGGGRYTSSDAKMESAENDIRNKAAEMGANYVAMDALGGDGQGMTLSGRAFQCDTLPGNGVTTNYAPPAAPPPPPAAPPPPPPTPEARLAKLKELLDKGLITQDEYDRRRAEILKSI
jgi:hypothetical protein